MIDVALYGHLTFDQIFAGSPTFEVGGIANVWRSLMSIDPKLQVKVHPLMIGTSHIAIQGNQKQNLSNLNQVPVKPLITEAKLSHIAYINELPDPEIVFQIQGFLTGDICTIDVGQGTPLKKEVAERFDLIFVSKEDLALIPDHYSKRLVVHAPTETSVYDCGRQIACCSNPEEYLEDINVLGAGDYFAAAYIYRWIQGNNDQDCAQSAQRKTTQFLKERYAKT
jgi:hypothetical protein